MRQHHQIVKEKRFVLLPRNEIEGVIAHEIGTVFVVRVIVLLAIDLKTGF
jgi:hypothetical protein